MTDPYASVPQPSYSGCDYNNTSIGRSSGLQYLSPGVYCKGLAFTNDAIVTMKPGVYIIDRGTFDSAAAPITGEGVTIFLTSSTGKTTPMPSSAMAHSQPHRPDQRRDGGSRLFRRSRRPAEHYQPNSAGAPR